MTKRYATTYANGHTAQTSSPHEANNFGNCGAGQQFFLSGKSVTAQVFFAAVATAVQAAWDKKAETHKRVRVLHGSSVASYVEKWVRK